MFGAWLMLGKQCVNFPAIVADLEAAVIIKAQTHWIKRYFLIQLAKLSEKVQLKTLRGTQALQRVELQQSAQQRQKSRVDKREIVGEEPHSWVYLRDEALGNRRIESLQVLFSHHSRQFDDLLQLFKGGRTREKRFASQKLSSNAANAPHINGKAIAARPKQQFRSAVPFCCHFFRKDLAVFFHCVEATNQPEVAEFNEAGGVEKDVGRLEVAMDELKMMQVMHC